MRQAGAILKLVSSGVPDAEGNPFGARSGDVQETGGAGKGPADATGPHGMLQSEGDAARGARHGLLKEWMGSHTRILAFWLDRLLEDGDEEDLVSMIHRQHAWLSMMQARLERG